MLAEGLAEEWVTMRRRGTRHIKRTSVQNVQQHRRSALPVGLGLRLVEAEKIQLRGDYLVSTV